MATQSAVTVVMSAPETPGAIDTRLGEPASATPVNASITPQTVPSNPRNGEPLTAVASKIICDSSPSAVSPTARSIAALTAPIWAGVANDFARHCGQRFAVSWIAGHSLGRDGRVYRCG